MNLQEELAGAGFKLVAVVNGKQAMAELEMDATPFRSLATDIRLGPGPNGRDIARRARELVPHVPVVYMSGDSTHERDAHGVPDSVMVAKPFVGAQIIPEVSTLLNQARPG